MNQQIPEGYKESTWKDGGECLISGKVYRYHPSNGGGKYRDIPGLAASFEVKILEQIAIPIEKIPTEITRDFSLNDFVVLRDEHHEAISHWARRVLHLNGGDRVEVTFKKLPKEAQ